MTEKDNVHQDIDGEDTDEVIDLEAFEDESPSDDDELEDDLEDGQEPDDEIPELGIDDPDAKKIWDQRWKGVIKREKRVAAQEKDNKQLLDNKDRVGNLLQIEQALGSPGHALPVLGQIVAQLKKQHGFSDADVAKTLGLTKADEDDDIEFADDKDVYRKAKEDAKREIEEKFGKKFDQLELDEAERTRRQKLNDYIDTNFNAIKKQVSDMAGAKLNFSRGQVEQALRAEPEIAKKDPAKAVFVHFNALIRKVQAKKTRTTDKKGPEMVKSSTRSGSGKKPDSQKSFSELARERGADPTKLIRDMFE